MKSASLNVKVSPLFFIKRMLFCTVEPRYNEPLYNKVLDITNITNDFLYHSNSKIYEKERRYNETSVQRTNFASPAFALRYIEILLYQPKRQDSPNMRRVGYDTLYRIRRPYRRLETSKLNQQKNALLHAGAGSDNTYNRFFSFFFFLHFQIKRLYAYISQ